jgi:hypothetical protein
MVAAPEQEEDEELTRDSLSRASVNNALNWPGHSSWATEI